MTPKKEPTEEKWDGICWPVSHPAVARAKGKTVSKVEHPTTKRTAVIRLDSHMWFWTIVGDDYFQSKSGDEVTNWAMHFLGKGEVAEWLPVLEVNADADRYSYGRSRKHQGQVSVEVDRYWIAKTNAGSWRQLDWEKGDPNSTVSVAPEDRMAESTDFGPGNQDSSRFGDKNRKAFALPYKSYNKFYLNYDEGLWRGLLGMIANINAIERSLAAALQTKEGLASIASGSPLLLPAPTDDKPKSDMDDEDEEADYEIEPLDEDDEE